MERTHATRGDSLDWADPFEEFAPSDSATATAGTEDLEDYLPEGLSAEQLMHESLTDQFRAVQG